MADQTLHEAFSECVDRMTAGQSMSDCLQRYPQYANELRPMLEIGHLIERSQADSYETAAAQARVRERLRFRMQQRSKPRSYRRLAALVASLVLAFAVLLSTAENSLPGDSLYGVKRFTENARSALAGQQFNAERLDEIRRLEMLQRPAQVDFIGQVEQKGSAEWHVAGLTLEVSAGVAGTSAIHVGDTIQVSASTTTQGQLIAGAITLIKAKTLPTNMPATVTSAQTPSTTLTPTPLAASCVPSKPQGWVSYIVQAGDTVSELAIVSGAPATQIIAVNCLPQTQMILVGQILYLPGLPPRTATPPPVSATSVPEPFAQASAGNLQPPNSPHVATSEHPSGEDASGD